MRLLVTMILTALALSACSSGGEDPADEPTALPTVSSATTCGQLFDGDAPVEAVVDLMNDPQTTPGDAGIARDYANDLEPIGDQAGDKLAPHVDVVVTELRTFADTVDERGSFDTSAMVTSLTELNNVCGSTSRY